MKKRKQKKVNIQSKKPFSQSHKFKIIDTGPKSPTLIKSTQGIVGFIMTIPLIAGAIWLINLSAEPARLPPGVQASPIPKGNILALTASMISYSIFLVLFYFSKRGKKKKKKSK